MFSSKHGGGRDRGAAAVEMALVLPLLMALVIGIIDFSRIFNGEIELTQAAREGARIAALGMPGFTAPDVSTRVSAALTNPALQGAVTATTTVNVVDSAGIVVAGGAGAVCTDSLNYGQVTVSIPYQKIWWGPNTLTQRAVMKCAG